MFGFDEITKVDPEVAAAMTDELNRQNNNLELIASENIVSKAVMAAMGSHLTNKYAEGYPGKRYYGGCQYVDVVEDLARERAKELFGCEYVNVQPQYGSIFRYFKSWRYIYGNESGSWRTSDTWITCKYVR